MSKKKPICPKCGGTIHKTHCLLCEMFAAAQTLDGRLPSTWPLVSEALAVAPRQVEEANARLKRHGIVGHYDPTTGCAVVPDKGNHKKLMKLEGFHQNNAFL